MSQPLFLSFFPPPSLSSHFSFPEIEAMENRDPSLESDLSSRYGNICLVDYRVFLAAGEGTISETLSSSRGTTMAHELGHSLGVWLASKGTKEHTIFGPSAVCCLLSPSTFALS
jgi:hypothetical protein